MSVHPLAGQTAPAEILPNIPRLVSAYYLNQPDPNDPAQQVSFGTSGHRGRADKNSFNEDHILAVCQAISEMRLERGIHGPLFLGMDTHALSEPAMATAIEVFAANQVHTRVAQGLAFSPTPVISHAILTSNAANSYLADGVVITPSHNPPTDGGFKYNPPEGGPADTAITKAVQARANQLLADGLKGVRRIPYARAMQSEYVQQVDMIQPYVLDLIHVIDMQAIADAGLRLGVDPLGGASLDYWDPIAERYKLNITVVNRQIDPSFRFMSVDHDGKIRMDCSSPYAMASLVRLKDSFDIAFGNDPDSDRHGIVTPSAGLMNPNHYLATAIWYLFQNRPDWPERAQVGKTLVSSSMIDRVAVSVGREVCEVPVGFKYFVDGLLSGAFGFGGEESAGASFLRLNGKVWTTDKDGILLDLLAAEMQARTGRDPGDLYRRLEERFGHPYYTRIDVPATDAVRSRLGNLSAEDVTASELAGEAITARLTHAPGNGAAIGGLKVTTQNGWFAARPSGTEPIYKIYAESFLGEDHLQRLVEEAKALVASV